MSGPVVRAGRRPCGTRSRPSGVRRRSGRTGDRGSATVEFAVALPVVTLVVVGLVAAVVLVDRVGRMQAAAGVAARALGRSDDAAAAEAVGTMAPGTATTVRRADGIVCVDVRGSTDGLFAVVPLRATGCAAEGGR